jgi:hypothetical protein
MHLQRRFKGGDRFANPSFVGDGGFWVPQEVFDEYIEANGAHPSADEQVRAQAI